jgi:nitrite reductase/ring-hydroxylating ferredoxin subunit
MEGRLRLMRVKQTVIPEAEFLEATNVDEIEKGKVKSVELKGIDVLIANIDGKFYAMADRCGHMNAMLSMGALRGKNIVCPFHFAEFDVTTGKKVKEPKKESFENMDKLPEDMQKFMIYAQKLVDPVETYDMQTYDVKVDGKKIFVCI